MNPSVKAIIAVDWGGRSCDYDALKTIVSATAALSWKFTTAQIIQDAAHCLYIGQSHGDYVCWSFGPIKHLTCGGYGGAILPPDDQYERAKLLRWHGLDRTSKEDFRCSQDIIESGYRYHMTDDQASVGLANLGVAQKSVELARKNAAWYCEAFKDVPGIKVPEFDPMSNYWIFTIIVYDREGLKDCLSRNGIGASQVHARNDKHTAFRRATARQDGLLKGVEYFDNHQLSIPVGAWVTEEERDNIAKIVINYARNSW
jgi:dTDP-4-amino-4,6-dideoxygalactose transaminase